MPERLIVDDEDSQKPAGFQVACLLSDDDDDADEEAVGVESEELGATAALTWPCASLNW